LFRSGFCTYVVPIRPWGVCLCGGRVSEVFPGTLVGSGGIVGVLFATRGLCEGSVRGGLVTEGRELVFGSEECVVVGVLVRIALVVGGSADGSSLSSRTCSSASCKE
jgi:hypothetical protein